MKIAIFLSLFISLSVWANVDLYWVSKASQVLRNGKPLSPDEELYKSLPSKKIEVIDSLMKTDDFTKMLLDFNLFFMGLKPSTSRTRIVNRGDFVKVYDRNLEATGRAIYSALKIQEDHVENVLFNYERPLYLGVITNGFHLKKNGKRERVNKNLKEHIERVYQGYKNQLETFLGQASGLIFSNKRKKEICDWLAHFKRPGNGASFGLREFGINPDFIDEAVDFAPNNCNGRSPKGMIVKTIKKYQSLLDFAYNLAVDHLPENFNQTGEVIIEGLKKVDLSPLKTAGVISHAKKTGFSAKLWRDLPNSSTNFNRKRSDYILSQFLCDDLTPVGVESPSMEMTNEKHGSETSCFACHYKLDPIAGYFMNIGRRGQNFSNARSGQITFDDGVKVELSDYIKEWNAPDNTLSVGIIKSTTRESKNILETESDQLLSKLFNRLKESNDVKKCMIKKMSKYVMGEETLVSAGYIDYLSEFFVYDQTKDSNLIDRKKRKKYLEKFSEDYKLLEKDGPSGNFSKALKRSLSLLIMSKTFSVQEKEKSKCYEEASEGGAPCEIAFILEKNCFSCHGDGDDLNLKSWSLKSDQNYNFEHFVNGKEQLASETFSEIEKRLQARDETSMPQDKYIDPIEKQKLLNWIVNMKGKLK